MAENRSTRHVEETIDVDIEKVEEVILALLHLTTFEEKFGVGRAWKAHDWDMMNRLHEKGWIHDPVNKSKSVTLTKEGLRRSRLLFKKYFKQEN